MTFLQGIFPKGGGGTDSKNGAVRDQIVYKMEIMGHGRVRVRGYGVPLVLNKVWPVTMCS